MESKKYKIVRMCYLVTHTENKINVLANEGYVFNSYLGEGWMLFEKEKKCYKNKQ